MNVCFEYSYYHNSKGGKPVTCVLFLKDPKHIFSRTLVGQQSATCFSCIFVVSLCGPPHSLCWGHPCIIYLYALQYVYVSVTCMHEKINLKSDRCSNSEQIVIKCNKGSVKSWKNLSPNLTIYH